MAEGNNLEKIRISEGLSLAELARLSGVSTPTIRKAENAGNEVKDVTKNKILKGLNKNSNRRKDFKFEEVYPDG